MKLSSNCCQKTFWVLIQNDMKLLTIYHKIHYILLSAIVMVLLIGKFVNRHLPFYNYQSAIWIALLSFEPFINNMLARFPRECASYRIFPIPTNSLLLAKLSLNLITIFTALIGIFIMLAVFLKINTLELTALIQIYLPAMVLIQAIGVVRSIQAQSGKNKRVAIISFFNVFWMSLIILVINLLVDFFHRIAYRWIWYWFIVVIIFLISYYLLRFALGLFNKNQFSILEDE